MTPNFDRNVSLLTLLLHRPCPSGVWLADRQPTCTSAVTCLFVQSFTHRTWLHSGATRVGGQKFQLLAAASNVAEQCKQKHSQGSSSLRHTLRPLEKRSDQGSWIKSIILNR